MAVIEGVFILQCMVFVLRKYWWWLNGGGHYHARKSGLYQRLAVGAVGGCSQVVGLDCVYIFDSSKQQQKHTIILFCSFWIRNEHWFSSKITILTPQSLGFG